MIVSLKFEFTNYNVAFQYVPYSREEVPHKDFLSSLKMFISTSYVVVYLQYFS